MTIDARGGAREWARRLIDAWPLTLGLAILGLILLVGGLAVLTHRRDEPPAVAPVATAPIPAEAPAAANLTTETGTAVAPAMPANVTDAAAPASDGAAALAGLAGEWVATDDATRSLTRVSVRAEGEEAFVHVWGKCHPDDCDWGEASAELDVDLPTPRLTATYEPGFATERLTLRRVRAGLLAYRVETDFTDGSGRGHQVSEGTLKPGV